MESMEEVRNENSQEALRSSMERETGGVRSQRWLRKKRRYSQGEQRLRVVKRKKVSESQEVDVPPSGDSYRGLSRGKKTYRKYKKAGKVFPKGKSGPYYTLDHIISNKEKFMRMFTEVDQKQDTPNFIPMSPENLKISPKEPKRNTLSREEKHTKELLIYKIMDELLSQIHKFSMKEKIGDFSKVAEQIPEVSAKECHRLWEKCRNRIKNSARKETEFNRQLRLDLEESFFQGFEEEINERLKIYQNQLKPPKSLEEKEDYTKNLLQQFSTWVNGSEKTRKESFKTITNFVGSNSNVASQTNNMKIGLSEEEYHEIYCLLKKSKCEKRIKKMWDYQDKKMPWSDSEKLYLIKGILRYGEKEWVEIRQKFNFKQFRTSSSLAYKYNYSYCRWMKLKRVMLEEISQIRAEGGKITKWEWMIAFARKMENRLENSNSSRKFRPEIVGGSAFPTRLPSHFLNQSGYHASHHKYGYRHPGRPPSESRKITNAKIQAESEIKNLYEECLKSFSQSIEKENFKPELARKFIESRYIPYISETTPADSPLSQPRPASVPPPPIEVELQKSLSEHSTALNLTLKDNREQSVPLPPAPSQNSQKPQFNIPRRGVLIRFRKKEGKESYIKLESQPKKEVEVPMAIDSQPQEIESISLDNEMEESGSGVMKGNPNIQTNPSVLPPTMVEKKSDSTEIPILKKADSVPCFSKPSSLEGVSKPIAQKPPFRPFSLTIKSDPKLDLRKYFKDSQVSSSLQGKESSFRAFKRNSCHKNSSESESAHTEEGKKVINNIFISSQIQMNNYVQTQNIYVDKMGNSTNPKKEAGFSQ